MATLAPSFAAAAAIILAGGIGSAQTVDPRAWVPNGYVHAVAQQGSTIYIGGDFSEIGPFTGSGVPMDGANDALPPVFPKVSGIVFSAIPDGAGG